MLSIETVHQPDFHRVVIARDPSTQYIGVIAVHDVSRGFALARGLFRAMEGAALHRWGSRALNDGRIAVQGCGATGTELIKTLRDHDSRVLAADVDPVRAEGVKRLGAEIIAPTAIVGVACDVFSTCALGGALDAPSARILDTGIVVGSANNQLASDDVAQTLHAREILYVPDFVANAGGVIAACVELLGWSQSRVIARIDEMADDVFALCHEGSRVGTTPLAAARARIQARRTVTSPFG